MANQTKIRINELTKTFLDNILELYIKNIISPLDYENILICISDLYDEIEDHSKFMELGYNLSKGIKYSIENEIQTENISMLDGLGYSAFAVSNFSKRFGTLNSYSKTLNSLLLKRTYEFSQNRLGHDSFRTGDYDLIFGLSGVLYYLLDSTWDAKHDIIKLNKIGEFLVYITENTIAEDNNIPRYFVEETPAGDPSDNYVDLGRAHGIISILIALTKFKERGFTVPNLDTSIDKLFEFYNNLYTNTYGWPITVYQSEFEMTGFRAVEKRRERESWCYGSASIAKGLIDSAINVSNRELIKKYYDIFYELINVDFDTYMLDDYILCHGYSGLITVIESLTSKSKDEIPHQYYLTNEIILNVEKKMKNIRFKKLNLNILEGISGQILALNYLNNKEMNYISLLMLI